MGVTFCAASALPGGALQALGGAAGAADRHRLLLGGGALLLLLHQAVRVHGLQAHQFAAAGHHHLAHLLEPAFQFGGHLLGVAVGALLDRGGFLAAAADQCLALLLGLLAELQGIVLHPLGFGLAALLQAQRFLADLLKLRQALLTRLLVLLGQLALQLQRLLFQLLVALSVVLLQ